MRRLISWRCIVVFLSDMARLLVIGGTGFVGEEICRLAVLAGHHVTAMARSKRVDFRQTWAEKVNWLAADVFQPESWRHALLDVDAVIHTVGTIIENRKQGVIFQKVNEESAVIAAKEAEQAGVPAFVFISAYGKPPLVNREYFDAKKRAEEAIAQMNLRAIFLRPSLIYGKGRPITYLFVWPLFLLAPVLGRQIEVLYPTSVTEVASASLMAALDPSIKGMVGIVTIKRLAHTFYHQALKQHV